MAKTPKSNRDYTPEVVIEKAIEALRLVGEDHRRATNNAVKNIAEAILLLSGMQESGIPDFSTPQVPSETDFDDR